MGICLDICHNRTIYLNVNRGNSRNLLHPDDFQKLKSKSLFDDIINLKSDDLVHLNDGSGFYSGNEKTTFKEGLALGEGDIQELPKIVKYLNENKIPFVLEINETDFNNRPNTKKSIDYLLSQENKV